MLILRSELLASIEGVSHGFSTRLGGLASGPGGSLDFKPHPNPGLDAHHQRFWLATDHQGPANIATVTQVHGDTVVDTPVKTSTEADAIASTHAGEMVGVRTADCVPVLMVKLDGTQAVQVAAVHAGWRGTARGVVTAAVQHLASSTSPLKDLRVAIGPCIGPDRFEVGPEVVEAARRDLGDGYFKLQVRPGDGDRSFIDLGGWVELQLKGLGLPAAHIQRIRACTHKNAALFHSYRRDGPDSGRMLSAIGLLASP